MTGLNEDESGEGRGPVWPITAVLTCAASLADKEGMHGTADRLRNDAEAVQRVHDSNDGPTVIIVQ